MPFNDGDFVKVDYTARRSSDRSLVYTTLEKIAREEDAYDAETKYSPQLVVLGKDSALKGVENAVKIMSVGEEKTVDMEPKDTFGERDDSLVNVMHLSDFRKKDINPQPGMRLDVDGRVAIIKSVNSGRVVVDMNHPLAGEKLTYNIKVVEKVETDDKKVAALSEHYSLKPDSVAVNGGVAKVAFGPKVKKDSNYLISKASFSEAIFRYMNGINKVVFEEEYEREKPETEKK
jgi:FKBP-type peptidyl-prolyl cis-trans isomerase 2